jgi:predicted RNA-binding Zn-ribbon protein involved in translation (DUF1610 family)
LNVDNELIEIHDAHRLGGEYYCPQCGDQMVCRCGTKNAWHFAHVKAKCNYDNYLHTIAEQRLLEWFNNTNDVSLVLQANEICERHNACAFYRKEICQKVINTKAFNLKQYYSSCEKEKHYEIDFMFERAGKIVAIEVKSGSNFTTSSLNNLKIKYPQLKFERIVISNKALSEKDSVRYLPIYMAFIL